MATDTELQCYNKACGAKFRKTQNAEKTCQHHPGVPVFHDALKGWSCCKKRTTDFTDFLKIPGCTFGFHSNEKPVEKLKPKVKSSKENNGILQNKPEITFPTPKPIKHEENERPSLDEELEKLSVKVTSSYDKAKSMQVADKDDNDKIKIGMKCRNGGCDSAYANGPSDNTSCLHHPGTAVFHEGMKYWSCCKRKTSDFTSFLNQAGCTQGSHVWKKEIETKVACRYDWHQTSQNVIVSIFAKNCNIDTSTFETNQVYLKASLDFEGTKHFELNMNLFGVVDPKQSKVTVSGTKVEVALHKGRASTWKILGEVNQKNEESDEITEEELKEINKEVEEESEGSDLDGIDDVIFD